MAEGTQRRLAAIVSADVAGYSRLIGADEAQTLAAMRAHRTELIDPAIADHGGRLVKTMGDGLLLEFPSVVSAVNCAIAVQNGMSGRNGDIPEFRRIEFRIGINLGDIAIEGDDIFGDGVNVAARLQETSAVGGVAISGIAHESLGSLVDIVFEDGGEQHFKNIARPIRVWRWAPDADGTAQTSEVAEPTIKQEVRFCIAPDGVSIAYALVGSGPPLVKAPNWMHHLEYDWESPVWGHLLRALAKDHMLVRFDQRGNGLSDWNVEEISFDSMISDMEAVVAAAGLDRFPLLGISQGCSYSIAYAIRHPERVSRLVLYGGSARGRYKTGDATDRQQAEMQRMMILEGWGQNNPAFRQFFTTLFMPGADKEKMDWFNELQRISISPENAARIRDVSYNTDVMDLLPKLSVPTLVLHCRDDALVSFEKGRRMAAMIPGARFVALEGENHLILEDEPAWPRFVEEVSRFLALDDI